MIARQDHQGSAVPVWRFPSAIVLLTGNPKNAVSGAQLTGVGFVNPVTKKAYSPLQSPRISFTCQSTGLQQNAILPIRSTTASLSFRAGSRSVNMLMLVEKS